MRPVTLIMEGFGTYRDRTEVDFDGVELFALSGPTGSGKSTVVDAICMALYGSIPRYEDQRLIAPAISTGLSQALVHLDFMVDGILYTAVRVIRRTPNGASTKEARLESGGETIAGNEKELTQRITELLGLTFDHFTRCVVLPQGQFAKFLHDKPKDRQELLKELLDITVYERIATAARERARDAKSLALSANERLSDLATATPEQRDALVARVSELERLYTQSQNEEATLSALAGEATTARETAASAATIAQKLQTIAVPAPVAELSQKATRNHEQLQAVERDLTDAGESLAAHERQLNALGDIAPLQRARQAHEQLAELVHATPQRREELAARVQTLEQVYQQLQADEAHTVALSAQLEAAITDAADELRAAEQLAALTVPAPVIELAAEIASVTTQLAEAETAVNTASAALERRDAQARKLGDKGQLAATRGILERRARLLEERAALMEQRATAAQSLGDAQELEASALATSDAAVVAVTEATSANEAHAVRLHLVVGEPCPVCEQVVTTLPDGEAPAAITEAKKNASAAAAALKATQADTAKRTTELERLDIHLEHTADQVAETDLTATDGLTIEEIDARLAAIQEATEAVSDAKERHAESLALAAELRARHQRLIDAENASRGTLLQAHTQVADRDAPLPTGADVRSDWEALVGWAHANAPLRAQHATALASSASELTTELETQLGRIRSKCEQAGVRPEGKQSASEATFGELRATTAAIERIDEQLATIERVHAWLAEFATQHPTSDASLAAIDRQLGAIADETNRVEEAKQQRDTLASRVKVLRDEQRDLATAQVSARADFLAKHAEVAAFGAPVPAGREALADWQALVAWAAEEAPTQVNRAAALAERAAEMVGEVERRRVSLHAEVEHAGIRVQRGQAISEAVFAAAQSARTDVGRIDEQLAKVEELTAAEKTHREEEVVATELARLLKADQFEKWLLDDVLTQLVEGATAMLMELSGEQFSLSYDDGDFLVVDHWNADQTRQAKTLSGGETFLASLSLALSLADQLAIGGGKAANLDALFLDEGFGTLDSDTLDVVASAIEELGSRGRMVGLISHVTELAERVPVRFEVQKTANASRIERVFQ